MHLTDFSRLFYLFEDSALGCVKEETFFNFLAKITPSVAIIIVSATIGQHFTPHMPLLSSCCTKTPIRWKENWISMPNAICIFSFNSMMCLIGLGLQSAIFIKLKQVELQLNQPSNHTWVISYDTENGANVTNSRLQSQPSSRRMLRHRRNLISPIGSCVSFIVMQIWYLFVTYYLFHITSSGPPIGFYILLFVSPSMDFFLLNLIETVLSPTLRNSLFDLICFGLI